MFEKEPMATYIVSQICFDPVTIQTWVARVRARGTTLPIWVGMPGIVDNSKLLRISMKIGLGESARFLRAHRAWLRRLLTRTFTPDPLLRRLDASDVAGVHFYTFNELERTERWRRLALERLRAA
jgi:methylenetetrahydrofolate reductase (NADPH)